MTTLAKPTGLSRLVTWPYQFLSPRKHVHQMFRDEELLRKSDSAVDDFQESET
jgi:hypothetical protein